LVKRAGIDEPRARSLRAKLEAASEKLTMYEVIWKMANADLADLIDGDDDESDADGEEA
jgi:hypothetical protein